jgi:hypothetical protein
MEGDKTDELDCIYYNKKQGTELLLHRMTNWNDGDLQEKEYLEGQ